MALFAAEQLLIQLGASQSWLSTAGASLFIQNLLEFLEFTPYQDLDYMLKIHTLLNVPDKINDSFQRSRRCCLVGR